MKNKFLNMIILNRHPKSSNSSCQMKIRSMKSMIKYLLTLKKAPISINQNLKSNLKYKFITQTKINNQLVLIWALLISKILNMKMNNLTQILKIKPKKLLNFSKLNIAILIRILLFKCSMINVSLKTSKQNLQRE